MMLSRVIYTPRKVRLLFLSPFPSPSRSYHRLPASPLPLALSGKILRVCLAMWRLFKEFLLFARQEKKWWLIPLVVLLLGLGAILIFASSSGIAWALYPFF
jgi:Family of unknown function (DUF5989)